MINLKKPTTSDNYNIQPLAGEALDYSDLSNWIYRGNNDNIDHEVDLFYLYPTSTSPDCKTPISPVDEAMKKNAMRSYLASGDALSTYTNVYAPYYRQVSEVGIMQNPVANLLTQFAKDNVPRTDVYAALDYYFENCNNGKPYVLMGYSQGSSMVTIILSEYMKVHPEYLKNMVACYAVGYDIQRDWLEKNTDLKFTTGETDTGTLITWEAMGPNPKNKGSIFGDGKLVINPLNWKTDETPAPVEMNKGSVIINPDTLEQTFVDGIADATINLERGVIVVTTTKDYLPDSPIFGDQSFHLNDYSFFYQNVKENALKRINAFLGHEAK